MHPKPEEEEPTLILSERSPGKTGNVATTKQEGSGDNSNHVTSGNLIQLDGYDSTASHTHTHFSVNSII